MTRHGGGLGSVLRERLHDALHLHRARTLHQHPVVAAQHRAHAAREVVVIAGGVTQAGEALFEPLEREVRRRAFKASVDAARIVPGTLPGTAGIVGAVATFKQQALGAV